MSMQGDSRRVMADYFQEVGDHPIRTAAEEAAIFRAYRSATDARVKLRLRHEIAGGYLKFVIRHAHKKTRNRELLCELVAEGNVGLMYAIDKFEVDRGFRFLTYAASWIDVHMREYINRNHAVHIPNHARKKYRQQRQEDEKLAVQGGQPSPPVAEPIVCTTDPSTLPADTDLEDAFSKHRTKLLPYLSTAGLGRRETFILMQHYGLRDTEPRTFREIAELMTHLDGTRISSDRVRQLEENAITRLRRFMADRRLNASADVF